MSNRGQIFSNHDIKLVNSSTCPFANWEGRKGEKAEDERAACWYNAVCSAATRWLVLSSCGAVVRCLKTVANACFTSSISVSLYAAIS